MDAERLSAVSGLSRGHRRARRVQRQVHDQSNGAARQLAGDAGGSFARHLSQLLLSVGALAVQRRAARGPSGWRRGMIRFPGSGPAAELLMRLQGTSVREPPVSDEVFARDVIAGLTARPKRLPPK